MSGLPGREGRKKRFLLKVGRAMRYMSRYWLDEGRRRCVLGRYSNKESERVSDRCVVKY
jgi:hypothetical protein